MLNTIIKFAIANATTMHIGDESKARSMALMDAYDAMRANGTREQMDGFTEAINADQDGSIRHAVMVHVATEAAAAWLAWPSVTEDILRGATNQEHPAACLIQAAIDNGFAAS